MKSWTPQSSCASIAAATNAIRLRLYEEDGDGFGYEKGANATIGPRRCANARADEAGVFADAGGEGQSILTPERRRQAR